MFNKKKQNKAFTLVELLIVIAVISLLFVVLISRVDFATDKARITGVQNDMHAIQYAIHQVALEDGQLVDDLSLLASKLNENLDTELMVRVEGNMLKTYDTDPWGNEYQLRYNKGTDNKGQVQMLSAGPDNHYGTQDDIVVAVVCSITASGTNVVVKDNLTIDEIIKEDGTIPNQPAVPEHTCSFNQQIQAAGFLKTAGNCTTQAVYFYSCECGAVGTATFTGSVDPSTHTTNVTYNYNYLNADNHTKVTVCQCSVTLDTATETHNFINDVCDDCGFERHVHNFNVQDTSDTYRKTAATCQSAAVYFYKCNGCTAKSDETYTYGEALDHNYTSSTITTQATCSASGVLTYTCSCGSTKMEIIPKKAHTEVTDKAVAATCTTTGLTEGKHCSVCNTVIIAQEVIPANGHTIGTEANCTNAQECTVCHTKLTAALGHDYKSTVKQPTCTEAGYTTHTCSRCGDTYTDSDVAALGHTEVIDEAVAETCTTTGLTAGKHCSVCNAVITAQTTVNALGHNIVSHDAKAATCTDKGYKAYEDCTRCSYTTYSEIAATGHTEVNGGTSDVHKKCSICGVTISIAHSYKSEIETVATCTSKGSTKYNCGCGYSYITQDIEALGHIDENNDNKCDRCNLVLKIVEGLGEIKVESSNDIENIEDIEISYNPDNGNLSGIVPPVNDTPLYPEVLDETLPTMIEFNGGKIQKQTNYTPGTYETVIYTTTHTEEVKSVYTQEWDAAIFTHTIKQDGTTTTVAKPFDISSLEEMPSIYIVYDLENNGKNITINGVSNVAHSVWSIYYDEDDSLENAIYLAHRVNLSLGKTTTTTHVAQWNGICYETLDVDDEILATKTVMKTYETTETKTVQITAPSTFTEYVCIPFYTLKAEEGMTWREWLASDYNTTGYTEPVIKTSDFEDVSYDDVIVAEESYGFLTYSLSGTWIFIDDVVINSTGSMTRDPLQNITFTSNGTTYKQMFAGTDGGSLFIGYGLSKTDNIFDAMQAGLTHVYTYSDGTNNVCEWSDDAYKTINFGSESQTVSQEFYEWFTANATKQVIVFTIDGVEYHADSGMTWEEWINSDYNTDGFCLAYATEKMAFVTLNGRDLYAYGALIVQSTMVIDSKINYTFTYDTGAAD